MYLTNGIICVSMIAILSCKDDTTLMKEINTYINKTNQLDVTLLEEQVSFLVELNVSSKAYQESKMHEALTSITVFGLLLGHINAAVGSKVNDVFLASSSRAISHEAFFPLVDASIVVSLIVLE